MKVIIIAPYPYDKAPSQRFRFEQYLKLLKKSNINYTLAPFIGVNTWGILYKEGHVFSKVYGVVKGFINRFFLMFKLGQYDYVFIHREAAPLGPAIFEWIVAKLWRKKIIYDFDDAIWRLDTENVSIVTGILKNPSKVNKIIKWSYKISCGNNYLLDHAKKYNANVVLNPTTIDTELLHKEVKDQKTDEVVIGWTGTHSTLQYLDMLIPVLLELEKTHKFKFLVICNKQPDFKLKSMEFQIWNKESEMTDLLKMNIGVMPLFDDEWSKGKCGFKALQYMSLGIPALVSPVGVNKKIVDHGLDGYICSSDEEWLSYLKLLIENSSKRSEMGVMARIKIENEYSVKSNRQNFIDLFS